MEEVSFMAIDLPIPPEDLAQIQGMLRSENPFCSSFPDEPLYSVMLYHQQKHLHGTETRMLLDRNIYARLLRLAKGHPASDDYRIPAAVMGFAQWAGILLEPNMAIYEGCSTQQGEEPARDIAFFRAFDNLHPSILVDIALGRTKQLSAPLNMQPVMEELRSIGQPLRDFSIVYPLVLKIGLLELGRGRQAERMRHFLEWMHTEWYYSPPVTIFAAMCFSDNAPRGVLKHLRSDDRQRALKGVRNAAWDLAYITYWGQLLKRQDREKCLWIFCSLDKALRRVARSILATDDDIGVAVRGSLCELMGEAAGANIYDYYAKLQACLEDPERAINRTRGEERTTHHRKTEASLERALLNGGA